MPFGSILTAIFDVIKLIFGYEKSKNSATEGQVALAILQGEEKAHDHAEDILNRQRNLSADDVSQLLKAPSDRGTGLGTRSLSSDKTTVSE